MHDATGGDPGDGRPGTGPFSAGPGSLIRNPADVAMFVRTLVGDVARPVQLVLGVGSDQRCCGIARREGPIDRPTIPLRRLVAIADALDTASVVVALARAGPPRLPVRAELAAFVTLRRRASGEGVILLDWVVIGAHHWWSLRERVLHEAT